MKLLLSLGIIIGLPLVLVWALNVFGAGIPYTFKTWFASLVLLILLQPWREMAKEKAKQRLNDRP